MIDSHKKLTLQILSSIKKATEKLPLEHWKEDWKKRVMVGTAHSEDEVIKIVDGLIADGFLAQKSYCAVTEEGNKEFERLRELAYDETEADPISDEKGAFDKCNLTPDLKAGTPIYRYLTVDNFYRLLDDDENAMAHFSKWEDPFEGFLFKGVAVLSGTKEFVDLHNLYSDYYGQCWTLDGTESDMRWRASACGTRGRLVRIESTIGRLFESLELIVSPDWLTVCCRMGQVEYKDEQEIRKLMGDVNLIEEVMNAPSKLLFIKRIEFESEKEFRVVLDVTPWKDQTKAKDEKMKISFGNGMAKYRVDFNSLVKSVLADPCMVRGDFDHLACRMCLKAPQIRVEQSTLFQWPSFVVQA